MTEYKITGDTVMVTISKEEYDNLRLAARQLAYALDMIPNLDDVIEDRDWDEDDN